MKKENEIIGTIEDIVENPKLVDKGLTELKRFSGNSPSFEPERRRFLKHAAVLAGLIASGELLSSCAPTTIEFGGKTYSGWEAYLLSQDIIRGPSLLIHPATRLPSDFEHHKQRPINQGWGAVDYEVPIGTPIVPTADAYLAKTWQSDTGALGLNIAHTNGYESVYLHLDRYSKLIMNGSKQIDKMIIIAFSGNTGRGPGPDGYQSPHLDFRVMKMRKKPGIDPFKLGIDVEKPVGGYGGRPVYWDGKTEIVNRNKEMKLQESLDTLAKRLKEHDELDEATVKELLKRQNNPNDLRDYLGFRVLDKKISTLDRRPQYEFKPGSLMYALMLEFYSRASKQEFIAMLPFIFPPLKPIYQKANPNVQL